jgi:hypothetical protein
MVLIHDMHLNFAERAPQRHLVGGGQVLIAEQQQLMFDEGRAQVRIQVIVDRLGEIHAQDLDTKGRAQRAGLELRVSHRYPLGFE